MGSMHPIRDEIDEMRFLADIDIFNSPFRNQKILSETLCKIEAAARACPKEARQIQRVKSIEKKVENSQR